MFFRGLRRRGYPELRTSKLFLICHARAEKMLAQIVNVMDFSVRVFPYA